MHSVRLFTDGSVHPPSKVGYGAYLLAFEDELCSDTLEKMVKTMRFEQTSSSKLELQTLLWALGDFSAAGARIIVYTDCQNILGLPGRRARFEKSDYFCKKHKRIANHLLYKEFYRLTDRLECEFVKLKGHKLSHLKDETDRLFTLVDKAARRALREAGAIAPTSSSPV
jgi:ribonuclease HI